MVIACSVVSNVQRSGLERIMGSNVFLIIGPILIL